MLRREERDSSLDNLAMGMGDGTISRGRAIKLAGAALAGTALSVFAGAGEAEASHLHCRRGVRCVRRRPNGTRRVFCCRFRLGASTCRAAILNGLCVRIS